MRTSAVESTLQGSLLYSLEIQFLIPFLNDTSCIEYFAKYIKRKGLLNYNKTIFSVAIHKYVNIFGFFYLLTQLL